MKNETIIHTIRMVIMFVWLFAFMTGFLFVYAIHYENTELTLLLIVLLALQYVLYKKIYQPWILESLEKKNR